MKFKEAVFLKTITMSVHHGVRCNYMALVLCDTATNGKLT